MLVQTLNLNSQRTCAWLDSCLRPKPKHARQKKKKLQNTSHVLLMAWPKFGSKLHMTLPAIGLFMRKKTSPPPRVKHFLLEGLNVGLKESEKNCEIYGKGQVQLLLRALHLMRKFGKNAEETVSSWQPKPGFRQKLALQDSWGLPACCTAHDTDVHDLKGIWSPHGMAPICCLSRANLPLKLAVLGNATFRNTLLVSECEEHAYLVSLSPNPCSKMG